MNKHTIVWDLDGTLYEDEHHFEYYMRELTAYGKGKAESMWGDYREALEGNHTLRLGRVYDVNQDLILDVDSSRPVAAWGWDGRPASVPEGFVSLNMVDMLSIGDQWWVAAAIAKHYGVSHEESQAAFRATREYMSTPAYTVTRVLGLKEFLQYSRAYATHTLLTNSPEQDSLVILSKLGLTECFASIKCMAQKPTLSQHHFKQAIAATADPNLVISVGDNYENEIAPALALGCKAVYIDRLNLLSKTYPGLLKVKNTVEAVQALKNILH